MALEVGMEWKIEREVTSECTAKALGSGGLLVYGTPAMILLMEKTAFQLVEKELEEGMTTVGTSLDVKHISASPVGSKITCHAKLIEIDRKRLVFEVVAFDNQGKIGEGIHERFLVHGEKFLAKAEEKLEKN